MKFKTTFLLFIITANVFGQLNTHTYTRKLEPVTKAGYYSIPLLPEIVANSKSSLNDLRIYNIRGSDTTEVPYLLNRLGDRIEETPIPFELINDVSKLKCCSYVTLKMEQPKVINRISLDVRETNFDKLLDIEGSNDNKQWFMIKQHLRIVGFTNSEHNFKSTSISFPAAQYGYFRIKFDDDSSEPITVNTAYAFEYKITAGNYDEIRLKSQRQTEDKKNKLSEVIAELGNNYIISHIKLKSAGSTDFYRSINIYRSNGTYHTPKGDEEAWQQIGSDVMASNEENTIELNNVQTTKLKIEILNYNDQPVKLDELKIYSEKISLTAQLPESDNLYLAYGKENEQAAVYDLVHFKEKIPAALTAVKYGREEIKPVVSAAKADPLISSKTWLWIAMGAVILLIGYFALSMIKKEGE